MWIYPGPTVRYALQQKLSNKITGEKPGLSPLNFLPVKTMHK
jgi:hypothetical protein